MLSVFRASVLNFLRDRPAILLSFILPVAFFSAFAWVFGGVTEKDPARSVDVGVVDLDRSDLSRRFVAALERERALQVVATEAEGERLDRASAEASVRAGRLPVALVIERGFETSFGAIDPKAKPRILLLYDSSDPIAPRLVEGLVQKTVMTALPDKTAEAGLSLFRAWIGGFTPQQEARMEEQLQMLRDLQRAPGSAEEQSMVRILRRDVVGEWKKNPIVAFYAAGFGVLFLLFTAATAGGVLLDEAESGTLDRILSSRISMTTLLLGKLLFLLLLGVTQLVVMFAWGALLFDLVLLPHLAGFAIMTISTALATSAFGLLLASVTRTRAQLAALSTLLVLVISALGGSMFPRFLMPESVQKLSLVFFNSWALEGFLKVFWRGAPLTALWPEVTVLVATSIVFLLAARRFARRWEVV